MNKQGLRRKRLHRRYAANVGCVSLRVAGRQIEHRPIFAPAVQAWIGTDERARNGRRISRWRCRGIVRIFAIRIAGGFIRTAAALIRRLGITAVFAGRIPIRAGGDPAGSRAGSKSARHPAAAGSKQFREKIDQRCGGNDRQQQNRPWNPLAGTGGWKTLLLVQPCAG